MYIGRENYKESKCEKLIGSSVFHSGICRNIKEGSFAYKTTPPESRYTVVSFDEMCNKIRKIKAEGLEKVFVHIDGWIKEGYDNQHPDTMPPCENAGGTEGMLRLKKQYRMQAINLRFMISTAIIMWMLPVIIKHIQKRMMMEKHLPFHCGMAENRSSYVHNFTLGL